MKKKAATKKQKAPSKEDAVNKQNSRLNTEYSVSPQQALQFLEDMRLLYASKDEATRAISLRVPENLLRSLKACAAIEGKKYQSLMIEILRQGLRDRRPRLFNDNS